MYVSIKARVAEARKVLQLKAPIGVLITEKDAFRFLCESGNLGGYSSSDIHSYKTFYLDEPWATRSFGSS